MERSWWVPLLGVGSVGLGGLQVLVGAALLLLGMEGPESGRTVFPLMALGWILPGTLLAAGGVGVVLGRRWGRALSLAAVLAGASLLVLVALHREDIPPAVADSTEWVANHPDAKGAPGDFLRKLIQGKGAASLRTLRDPSLASEMGWAYTGAQCLPVLPWYLVVLVACGSKWGDRIVRKPDKPAP